MAALTPAELFPLPSVPSAVAPVRLPGVSPASGAALVETLKANHASFHLYFNDRHFHNHTSHHLFAIYALGASPSLVRAAYTHNATDQRPRFASPAPINAANLRAHFEDEKYYDAYLAFFDGEVKRLGMNAALEEHVLSVAANVDPEAEKTGEVQPYMLVRFLAAVVHPIIHAGYGAEFDMPGMVVEGLAWTALHSAENAPLFPASVFSEQSMLNGLSGLAASVSALALGSGPSAAHAPAFGHGVHALTVLARALRDPRLAPATPGPDGRGDVSALLTSAAAEKRAALLELSEQWCAACEITSDAVLEAKIEELAWLGAVVYAVGGCGVGPGGAFFADFFLMHLVTSSLFLPTLCARLSRGAQTRLLRGFFATALAQYVARGRPALPFAAFFAVPAHEMELGLPAGARRAAAKSALQPEAQDAPGNAWLPVLASSLLHPEAHVPKATRALAHWAERYGTRPAGHFAPLGTAALGDDGLPGVEHLDGTLFLRAAVLSIRRNGWVHAGEEALFWDGVPGR